MDVLTLDLMRSTSPSAESSDRTRDAASRRERVLAILDRVGRALPGGTNGDSVARRHDGLLAFTALTIALGLGLLVMTTLTNELWSAIDPGIGATTILAGPTGGLLLWLLYGLLGSLRVLRAPGGSVVTFHMPFVGAAMLLGGPTAGAWVAFLSTVERRELEEAPWYGILANHAVMVIGVVLGAGASRLVGTALPDHAGGGTLLMSAIAGAVVLALVANGLSAVTVLLREEITPRALIEDMIRETGRLTAVECALVVVLALAYVQVGWWAPVLAAGFVLLAWDNDPMPPLDPLTGMHSKDGFLRLLEAGVGRMRSGVTPSATLMFLDLDRFKWINDTFSYGVGNEVLAEVAKRLRAHVRRPGDIAGRFFEGDEFVLFFPGLGDTEVAMRRADEIVADLCRSIATSAGTLSVGVSLGVVVIESWGGVPSSATLADQAASAMKAAKDAGGGSHLFNPDEPKVSLRDRRSEAGPSA
jgi:diguanylate cyclase (GGDEF)-like protein